MLEWLLSPATSRKRTRAEDDVESASDSAAAKAPRTEPAVPHCEPISGRVILNVGGMRYESTVETLSNGGSGYFAARFGSTGMCLGAEDGRDIFVDCDGRLFAHVLHWLRRRSLPAAIRGDEELLTDVSAEAEFYGLGDLSAACQLRVEELNAARDQERERRIAEQRPKARSAVSFSLTVHGTADDYEVPSGFAGFWYGDNETEMPQPREGEVVYVHSAVLCGPYAKLCRMEPLNKGATEQADDFARTPCYLNSGLQGFDGDFQLLCNRFDVADDHANPEDDSRVHVLAHRGLDDANVTSQAHGLMHDVDFRHVLDMCFHGKVRFRAKGLGNWHVHGWVGPIEEIPRAGVAAPAAKLSD